MPATFESDDAERFVDHPIEDDEFSTNVHRQLFELWIEPELVRRANGLRTEDVSRALVLMHPAKELEVLLNDQVGLVAEVQVARDVQEGEPRTFDDVKRIARIRPYGIDPDAAFMVYAVIGGSGYIAFDFRRYKGESQTLLAAARDFLDTANDARVAGRLRPAVENGYAAAELVVSVQMRLFDSATRSHRARAEWWEAWAQIGNAPIEHGTVLRTLWNERSKARYAEGELALDADAVTNLLLQVEAMLSGATKSAS